MRATIMSVQLHANLIGFLDLPHINHILDHEKLQIDLPIVLLENDPEAFDGHLQKENKILSAQLIINSLFYIVSLHNILDILFIPQDNIQDINDPKELLDFFILVDFQLPTISHGFSQVYRRQHVNKIVDDI